jgi:hypothetical protein
MQDDLNTSHQDGGDLLEFNGVLEDAWSQDASIRAAFGVGGRGLFLKVNHLAMKALRESTGKGILELLYGTFQTVTTP